MERKYNKRERRAIYKQMAIDFETGKETRGICYAFQRFMVRSSYYPIKLIKVFPELEVFFGEKVENHPPYEIAFIRDEDGQVQFYGNFENMLPSWYSDESKNIRVSILTLCAEMCK